MGVFLPFAMENKAAAKGLLGKLGDAGKAIAHPWITTVRHPITPIKSLAEIVIDVTYYLPKDFWHYATTRNGNGAGYTRAKMVSHSLAIGEAAAFFGAGKGAQAFESIVANDTMQAVFGGFVGSEITTALTLFLAYGSLVAVKNMKKAGSLAASCKTALYQSAKVTSVSVPAGLLAFGAVDIPVASALSFVVSAKTSAVIGAICGATMYAGTAKAAIANANKYL